MKRALLTLLVLASVVVLALLPVAGENVRSFVYVSPAPGAYYISPATSLAIRHGSPWARWCLTPQAFVVMGSRSGLHTGTVRLSDDELTLLFYPDRPFAYAETVSVHVRPGLFTADGVPLAGVRYEFHTLARPVDARSLPSIREKQRMAEQGAGLANTRRYHTYPEFADVMTMTVTTPASGTADGLVFVTSMGRGTPAQFIVDNMGEPVFIQLAPAGTITSDFKRQTANGVEYLVYYVGTPFVNWAYGTYYVMNNSYTIVDSWTIGNGYGADLHEMQLLPNGHALLLSYTPIPVDLTPYGGPADGIVIDTLIQEQDSAKNVVFEWHGSQHIPLTDSYMSSAESPVDYMHTNAIELDQDGNLMISSRHLSEITKINRQTGAIMWRMGGKSNQFTFTNDGGFSYQHDIRRLANGHVTLFDNGVQHRPRHSRAVEFILDEVAKTVTRAWQYPSDTSIFAAFMGSAQRLPNGNTMIGWGALPRVTEVRPDGTEAFALALGALTYRAFRFPWDAAPTELPRLVIEPTASLSSITAYVAWNGATNVSTYEIYAGESGATLSLVATAARTGFETTINLNGLDEGMCAFQARPVDAQGEVLGLSPVVYRRDLPQCRALLYMTFFPVAVQ